MIYKYITNKAYILPDKRESADKNKPFFLLFFILLALSLVVSSHYTSDSIAYHEEYFTQTYCSVVDDKNHFLDSLTQIVFQNLILKKATSGNKIKESFPNFLPVDREYSRIASAFGYRNHPILKKRKIHEGVDYDAPYGSSVYASGGGKVIGARYFKGYGKIVQIEHEQKLETRYGHLSTILVKEGQIVKKGDVIARVGNTGLSTTAHLHFEIRLNGEPVNPIDYCSGEYLP